MAEHWVVVGAGSAGCVVANRLSADGDREITLLDDGPDLTRGAVPLAISGPSFFDALAEPGRTHPDLLACRVSNGEQSIYQRGRGIGGSSAVNAMVSLRGSDQLYESWGWRDTTAAWARVDIPTEPAASDELGAVDRALLGADTRAEAVGLTRRAGRRVTSAEAYLWPVLDRANLTVRPNSAVDTVIINDRHAAGVRLSSGDEVRADRVIMCAGAIHSPTILLRSGIDTPGVGQGLQDHPSAVFTIKLRPGVDTDSAGLPIGALLHAAVDDNTIQLLPMSHLGPDPAAAGLGAMLVALMTPAGRAGTVTVDAAGVPQVDFALLDDERDLRALTAGVRLALEVLQRPAFTSIAQEVFIDDRGTPAAALDCDDAIEAWLLRSCGDYVHASSSCAMGTVVDDRGAVADYDGLYVCDASIFPSIPDANTHLPTTMAAERLCVPGRLLP